MPTVYSGTWDSCGTSYLLLNKFLCADYNNDKHVVTDVYPQVICVCFHNLNMSITWAWVGCVLKAQMFFIQQTIRLLYRMKLHDFWGIPLSPPLPVSQDQDTGPGIQPMRAQSSIFSCPLPANLFDSIYVTSTILTCRSTFKWCMKDMNWKNV